MTKLEQYQEIQAMVQKDARDIALEVYAEGEDNAQYNVPRTSYHEHNDIDAPRIPFPNIEAFIIYIPVTVQGVQAQTSTNYSVFWIAPTACNVVAITEVHKTAGTDGGAVTLQVEKLTGTIAPGSGANILSTSFNLKAPANTVQTGALTPVITTKQLATGDRLGLVVSGTLTTLSNVTVMVKVQFI